VTIDAATRRWTRNASDELAASRGCRFNPERGSYTAFWIERYCRLYEGVAGEPMLLHGCHECGTYGLPIGPDLDDWEAARPFYLERAERFAGCVAAGHDLDWQYDGTMRLFGWERYSERWRRLIRRFRQAVIFVSKKNKKTPTEAAWCFFSLAGDGEPGQKVFLAAKDGKQARKLAGEHMKMMLLQSPELEAECGINLATMRITHRPSNSWMEPLSSANIRTQKSQEGLNGSVFIDEAHVVDREFVARISRAGISRSEPLHVEVSTAGNEPDSYGKERFDLALKVRDAEPGYEDDELFAAVYAAPQDLKDSDLEKEPLRYGRMANPAWGHTVDPEEFLKDYQRSKRSIGALADFKMYRLNIWQQSTNPWLKSSDWARCRRDYAEADLEGQECIAALDLSRTRDMSALLLMFPAGPPETFRVLPYFWLPEEYARENAHLAPFLRWAEAGHLTLTPGNVIDFGFIKGQIRKLHPRFPMRELTYDGTYAEDVTQQIEQGEADDEGKVIVPALGVQRVMFRQKVTDFALPTAQFERLVLAERLWHNGHPVLTWQIGHTQVSTDVNMNKRPVKPHKDSVKKVDGVVAAIMCLGRWLEAQPSARGSVEAW
jgi:phage terminase large subunit-like protein